MKYFITHGSVYYEADSAKHEADIEVSQRPSVNHDWIDGSWSISPANPLVQIEALEAQQTPRRIREAAIGIQESIDFLQDIEDQIEVLRGEL